MIDPPDQLLEFANPRTFQIVSAGLDDNYGNGQSLPFGGLPASLPGIALWRRRSPRVLQLYHQPTLLIRHDALPAVDPRVMVDFHSGHMDNIASFSEGKKLEDVEQ